MKNALPQGWKGMIFFPLLIVQGCGTLLEKSTYSLLRVATVILHLCFTVLDKCSYYNRLFLLNKEEIKTRQ